VQGGAQLVGIDGERFAKAQPFVVADVQAQRMRLFTILPTCPAPAAPRWKTSVAKARTPAARGKGDFVAAAEDEQLPGNRGRLARASGASNTTTPRSPDRWVNCLA